jgi:hypothetical protein
VLAAAPVDDQNHLAGLFIDVYQDFLHQCAHELLLDSRISGGSLPRPAEIHRQSS